MQKNIFTTFLSILICSSFVYLAPCILNISSAQEYDAKAAKARIKEGRRTPPLSAKIYKHMMKVQKLIDQKEYQSALDALEPILELKPNSYEEAQYWGFKAFLFYSMENYKSAIDSYETMLKLPNLPIRMEDNTFYTLSQLYFIAENYEKSRDYSFRILKYNENPPAQIFTLVAQSYYSEKNYDLAMTYMLKSKDKYTEKNKPMGFLEYKFLISLYFMLDQKYNILKLFQEITRLEPSNEAWTMVAKISTKLIAEHDEQAPQTIAELNYIRNNALDNAALPTINIRKNYTETKLPYEYSTPIYPREALISGINGEVTLLYDVTEDGTVTNIRVTSSTGKAFEKAATNALKLYKYNPVDFGAKLPSEQYKIELPKQQETRNNLDNPLEFGQFSDEPAAPRKDIVEIFKFNSDIWDQLNADAENIVKDTLPIQK